MEHKTSEFTAFIGIDVAKNKLDIAFHGQKKVVTILNNKPAILKFIAENEELLFNAFIVVDLTGGYEALCANTLYDKGFSVHRSDGRKVKSFIRSFGERAKTDVIDARMLAKYGADRHELLSLFARKDCDETKLFQLNARRDDLVQMHQKEVNRSKAPDNEYVAKSCKKTLTFLKKELTQIEADILKTIKGNKELLKKFKLLKTEKGVGEKTAFSLLANLSELGNATRNEIAALAGVAPFAKDSGDFSGYRTTKRGGGRPAVKKAMFIAILTAIRYNEKISAFYNRLLSKGKSKMVAIVACIRKLLVILNAKCKELYI